MKQSISFIVLLLFGLNLFAQFPNYNVVFDFSSKDSLNQQAVIRQVDLIKSANPDAKLEVVIYGPGVSLVAKNQSKHVNAIEGLLKRKDVSFTVCEIAMKRNNVTADQLIPGVKIVPDGIYEIITKQREGWGYIKVAH